MLSMPPVTSSPGDCHDEQTPITAARECSSEQITNQKIAHQVREDIRQVLSNSWELQQLNKTAPRVSNATIDSLALPKKSRIQQQVNHGLHDVSDFARWKAAQLARRRRAAQQAARQEQQLKEAKLEALREWHREQEQLGRQLHIQHQQQLEKSREAARRTAALATQQAKADLQVLKEKQQKQRLHAAELRERLTSKRMDTSGAL